MKKIVPCFLLLFIANTVYGMACHEITGDSPIDIRELDQIYIYTNGGKNHFQVERKGIVPNATIFGIFFREIDREPDLNRIAQSAQEEFFQRHTSAVFDIRQITFRMEDPLKFYEFLRNNEMTILRDYMDPFQRAMSQLYDSYARQGVERVELLPTIRQQDESEANRVTHFVIQRGIQPVAHIQLLESLNAEQKLHIEEEFPIEAQSLARRNSTEKIGELGRLYVTNPNQKHSIFDSLMTMVDGFNTTDAAFYQFSVLHEAISYAIYYGNFDRLLLQINLKVEKVLQRKKVPLHLAKRLVVEKTWQTAQGEETVTEVIYSFDRAAMQAMDDFFLKEVYKRQFEEVLTNSYLKARSGAFFEFQQREVLALLRLGILDINFTPMGLAKNNATQFQDPITQEWKGIIYISQKQMEDFLNLP